MPARRPIPRSCSFPLKEVWASRNERQMVLLWYFRVPVSGSRLSETRTSHVREPKRNDWSLSGRTSLRTVMNATHKTECQRVFRSRGFPSLGGTLQWQGSVISLLLQQSIVSGEGSTP